MTPSLEAGVVPEPVADLVRGRPAAGTSEQAFVFLTVDEHGYPHVALLSRAELDVTGDRGRLLAAIASTGTTANLRRDGHAGLVAVEGTTAHELKLRVEDVLDGEGMTGFALAVAHHKADSLGIPLQPVRFPATDEVAALERWDRSEALLARLGAG